jgi:3-oxoacyl-[acyl-carrier protein] reductase
MGMGNDAPTLKASNGVRRCDPFRDDPSSQTSRRVSPDAIRLSLSATRTASRFMDLGLKGKVALVAASSKGLGFAVAEELAVEGARLIMNGRGEESLDKAVASIEERFGSEVLAVPGDVSIRDDTERIVKAGFERFGQIDILITNSGGPPAGRFDDLSAEQWEDAVRLLLTSVTDLTRLVLPGMKQQRWGRILNITSIAAKQPVANLILSNSLRAGVTGFSKTLAAEVGEYGITVNTILPGYTATERVEELANHIATNEGIDAADVRKRWEAEIPLGRLADPKEFAAMAAFLVSERASYVTGSSIAVDGGWIKSVF